MRLLVSDNVLTNLSHTFLTFVFLACLLAPCTYRFAQCRGRLRADDRDDVTMRQRDALESALLGSANGLMCATRKWECAQFG